MARWRVKASRPPSVWTALNRPEVTSGSQTSDLIGAGAADYLAQRLHSSAQMSTAVSRQFEAVHRANNPQRTIHPFDRQIPRPDIVQKGKDVNENRFNVLEDKVNVKKIPTPNLRKAVPRRSRRESRRWQSVEYSPNFQSVWKRQVLDFSFDKAPDRFPVSTSSSFQSPLLVSYSQVQSKVPTPNFKRSSAKSQSPMLPIHMQNIVSWQGLHALCDQMLHMNGALPVSRTKHNRTISQ